MSAKKFLFCFPLKYGAWIMAFINLIFAVLAICVGTTELFYNKEDEILFNLAMCIIVGVFNIFIGLVLLAAIFMGKEKLVLLYLLLEMSNLMMITIFTTFYMFEYRSIMLTIGFVISLVLWYGLHCMYGYYAELAEYNSVKSGVIEISCNTQINPLMVLPEKAIESTAV